jgi:hypothetical protein
MVCGNGKREGSKKVNGVRVTEIYKEKVRSYEWREGKKANKIMSVIE